MKANRINGFDHQANSADNETISVHFLPLLQHACPPSDRQPDPRPMFDRFSEPLTSLVQIVAGRRERVEVAIVREQ